MVTTPPNGLQLPSSAEGVPSTGSLTSEGGHAKVMSAGMYSGGGTSSTIVTTSPPTTCRCVHLSCCSRNPTVQVPLALGKLMRCRVTSGLSIRVMGQGVGENWDKSTTVGSMAEKSKSTSTIGSPTTSWMNAAVATLPHTSVARTVTSSSLRPHASDHSVERCIATVTGNPVLSVAPIAQSSPSP